MFHPCCDASNAPYLLIYAARASGEEETRPPVIRSESAKTWHEADVDRALRFEAGRLQLADGFQMLDANALHVLCYVINIILAFINSKRSPEFRARRYRRSLPSQLRTDRISIEPNNHQSLQRAHLPKQKEELVPGRPERRLCVS